MTRFFLPLLSSFFLLSCSSNGQQNADVFAQFQLSDAELKNYLAVVKVDDKFGIANALGEMVLPAEYENRPQRIMWDKVIVYNDSGYGLVSLENELLMPMNQRGISYAEGFRKEDCFFSIRTSNTTFDFVDLDLNPLESAEWYNSRRTLYYDYNNFQSKRPVTFQIKNLKKEEQLSFKDEEFLCWIGPYNEGMAPIYLTKHAGVKYSSEEPIYYGFINEKGKLAIPIQYKMVDQYRAQGNHVEDYNRLRFEDGKALIWTRGAYFMINTKGDTVHAFDENVDAVYPVLKEGTRMLSIVKNTERGRKKEKILVDREFNVIYQNGQDGWEYTLKGIGLSEFDEHGYTIQHHRAKKEFRIVNHRLEETFKHTFTDDTYIYDLKNTDIDSLYWLERIEKDSLDGPMTRYDKGVPMFKGEKRLVSRNGEFFTDWQHDPYIYSLQLGVKYKWYDVDGIRYSELKDLQGNLLQKFENIQLQIMWDEKKDKRVGLMAMARNANGGYNRIRLKLNGESYPEGMHVVEHYTHKDHFNLMDEEFYQNPGFKLKFDEDDVRQWYKALPKND